MGGRVRRWIERAEVRAGLIRKGAPRAQDHLLFHGPCFQLITNLARLDGKGALAEVLSSRPAEWLPGSASDDSIWLFDWC